MTHFQLVCVYQNAKVQPSQSWMSYLSPSIVILIDNKPLETNLRLIMNKELSLV